LVDDEQFDFFETPFTTNMPIAGSVVIRERRARHASRAMW